MARHQGMHPLARSTMRRQIERNAARDAAAQRWAARRAGWIVRQALEPTSSIRAAQLTLAALAQVAGGDPCPQR